MKLTAVLIALFAALALAPAASAGTWTLDTCTLPSGAPASTDGWATGWSGTGYGGSGDTDTCSAGGSLAAIAQGFGYAASGPMWTFSAPAGETIAGGEITASLDAAEGETWIATPNDTNQASDSVAYCYATNCGTGTFSIAHPGGTSLYAVAHCFNGNSATNCSSSGINGEVAIHRAEIELSDQALPTGSGFQGPLLTPNAHGISDLLFTATDPNLTPPGYGPGVYGVVATIDGTIVYAGTPDTNDGACVAVPGAPSGGGLMFASAQPCPAAETVDIPIDTTRVPDGGHDLRVIVSDAAGNTASVLDTEITVGNGSHGSLVTPRPARRRQVQARLVINWLAYPNGVTKLVAVHSLSRLPAHLTVQVACAGRGCPRLPLRSASTPAQIRRLWQELARRSLHSGERLILTLSQPGRVTARYQMRMRTDAIPVVKRLS